MLIRQVADEAATGFLCALDNQDGVTLTTETDGIEADAGADGIDDAERLELLGDGEVLQLIMDEDDALASSCRQVTEHLGHGPVAIVAAEALCM